MKISEIFQLEKSQAELDFVDIDIRKDIPLFLDPFFLSLRTDNWSTESVRTIRDFFQRVIDLIRNNDIGSAKELFVHLHEPNSTCLGMSKGVPKGRGVGKGDTDDIFESILKSNAIQSGLIEDLEDNILFVEGFGKDKLSDMTTNIITNHLIEYTQNQCKLHDIKMNSDVPSGFYWNRINAQWEQRLTDMLVVKGKVILLVPKGVVSFTKDYTGEKYYQHFVLNFMQNEHLRMKSTLVNKRKNGTLFVTKKDISELNPYSKEFIADFTRKYPKVLENFKKQTKISSLNNNEIGDIDIRSLKQILINGLTEIPKGKDDADKYHKFVTGVLEFIFYPHLISPSLEVKIHDGRKRIDITFDNAATDGIFYRLWNALQLSCQFIIIECKNYTGDPKNPELDQLSGRFSPNKGKVGFLLCREIKNVDKFIASCADTYKDGRGLIVPLQDSDLIEILKNHNERENSYLEKLLSERIRLIMVS